VYQTAEQQPIIPTPLLPQCGEELGRFILKLRKEAGGRFSTCAVIALLFLPFSGPEDRCKWGRLFEN
jgi:hypothetical protein